MSFEYLQDVKTHEQDGCTLAYVDEGAGGPPLLFLHGHAGSIVEWDTTISTLKSRFRCVAPDLPGHGKSCMPEESNANLDSLVRAAIGLIDFLSLVSVVVVGHSMGGRVAAHMALQRPDLVRSLVLVNAPADQPLPVSLKLITQFVPLRMLPWMIRRQALLRSFIRRYSSRMVLAPNRLTERKARYFRDLRSSGDMPARVRYLTVLGRDLFKDNLDERLHEIRVPMLIVWSDSDPNCPLSCGELILKRVPRSRLVVMEGCAHNPHLESFEAFNEHLIHFVTEDPTNVP